MTPSRWRGFLLLLLAGCATVRVEEARVITGLIRDPRGEPVAGTPVVLVARVLELNLSNLGYDEKGRREIKTVTDAQGRYRLEVVPSQLGNNFYLFFYGEGFDAVQFKKPESVELTDRLKESRVVTVHRHFEWHPDWPEVQRLIYQMGADSERGRVLRQFGLPEKQEAIETGSGTSEVWHYFAKGVSYRFLNGRLVGVQEFTPIKD